MTSSIAPTVSSEPRRVAQVAAKSKIVYLFAIWGVLMVGVALHAFGSWILSADFKPSPMGADPLPAQVYWTLRIIETLAVVLAFLLVWHFMIKPWRRTGAITWDGMFMISGFLLWWGDPLDNYFNFTFMYNSGFLNMASWTSFIPGWEAPNQNLFPEPLLFVGGLYIWWFIAPVALGCWVLNQLKSALPVSSIMTRLLLLFAFFTVFDFVIENIFTRLQVFAYVGSYAPLTVWAGTPNQFPVYNSFIMASFFMGMTCLRYFKDDQGNSFAERGIESIRISGATKTVLRQFALIGFLNLNIMLLYFFPYCLFSMKADSFPKYPSYMLAEICGKGTPYACPSGEVPIPRRHSIAIGPNDPRLSADATRN